MWMYRCKYIVKREKKSNNLILLPVQKAGFPLRDECLPGESHGQEVDDQDDDPGRHELREARVLKSSAKIGQTVNQT